MRNRPSPSVAILLAVGLLAGGLLTAGALGVGPAALGADDRPADGLDRPATDRLVRPDGTGSYLWPYTSRSRSVRGRTLAINVVIRGEVERTRRLLERRADGNWTAVDAGSHVGRSPWRAARGSARYTYVTPDPSAAGRWVPASYQLATGSYLGARTHVRAYPAPAGNWTAFQAHAEYWDWFRLRHTVTGVASGARFVERDLRDEPFVEAVTREYHGLGGNGNDGWLTVVEFVPAALAGAALPLSRRREWSLADAALPASIAALVLFVRAAGVAAEGLFPGPSPKLFAAVLYPVLAVGPLVLAAALARDRPPGRAALLAAAGLGAGVVLDLGSVGVALVSVRLALHRVALLASLGAFAFGVARADRRVRRAGLAAWIVALAAALLGFA